MKIVKLTKFCIVFSVLLAVLGCFVHPPSSFKIFDHFNEQEVDPARISRVIDWAKKEGYLAKLDISEENAAVLFRSMLVDHTLPEELRNNKSLRSELLQVSKEKAGENSPLSPEEAKRSLELIKSGEIFNDIFYSFNVIFSLITNPERFTHLGDNFKSHIKAVFQLPKSLISDLNPQSVFERVSAQIERVKKREQLEDPVILNNTLKTVFLAPEVGNTVEVVSTLLAPENESLRIAVLVYARLNGINLEQKDIDEVRGTILNKDDPKLGALLMYLLTPENAKRLAGS